MSKFYKNDILKNNKKRVCFLFTFMVLFVLINVYMTAETVKTYAEGAENDQDEVYYAGKTTRGVNVRVGAGTNNEILKYNNEDVSLPNNKEVIIIGEEMVGDKPWYHIRFEYGGTILEGYSTSTYIDKSTVTITPTPIPTPTPTITPTPSPTPTLTPTPFITEEPTEPANPSDKDSSFKWYYIAIPVFAALILGYGFIETRRRKGLVISGEIDKLKNISIKGKDTNDINKNSNISDDTNKKADSTESGKNQKVFGFKKKAVSQESEDNKDNVKERLHPEIKVSKNSVNPIERGTKGVYVKGKSSNIFEEDNIDSAEDSKNKAASREELESLRQDDVITHKYFGKGVVYDNSDVNLIEIRFGDEQRFLNKSSMASKKLIKICEEERSWRR